MNASELFLFMWAALATAGAIYYHQRYKIVELKYDNTGNLLCDVVVGDVEPTQDAQGYWTVENSHTRIVFKRISREV